MNTDKAIFSQAVFMDSRFRGNDKEEGYFFLYQGQSKSLP